MKRIFNHSKIRMKCFMQNVEFHLIEDGRSSDKSEIQRGKRDRVKEMRSCEGSEIE